MRQFLDASNARLEKAFIFIIHYKLISWVLHQEAICMSLSCTGQWLAQAPPKAPPKAPPPCPTFVVIIIARE